MSIHSTVVRFFILALSAVALGGLLGSCGGGSNPDAENAAKVLGLRAQAEAKQLEAKTLGQDSPCITAAQCKALVFSVISGNCPAVTYHAYASLAPTAAQAEAAALEQRNLAQQANAILAPNLVCPAIAPAPAVLLCNANKCSLGS